MKSMHAARLSGSLRGELSASREIQSLVCSLQRVRVRSYRGRQVAGGIEVFVVKCWVTFNVAVHHEASEAAVGVGVDCVTDHAQDIWRFVVCAFGVFC